MAYKEKFDYCVNLVFIGDDYVGKTSLMNVYADRTLTNDSTVIRTRIVSDLKVKQVLWDTIGLEIAKPLVMHYSRMADGLAFVFDVTNMDSFQNVQMWLDNANKHCKLDCVKMLIGNKVDLEDKRVVTAQEAQAFAQANSLTYIETSAMTSKHYMKEKLDQLTDEAVENIKKRNIVLDNPNCSKFEVHENIPLDDRSKSGKSCYLM